MTQEIKLYIKTIKNNHETILSAIELPPDTNQQNAFVLANELNKHFARTNQNEHALIHINYYTDEEEQEGEK